MSIAVTDARVRKRRQELIAFIYKNITKQSDERRFEWLYEKNAYGKAKVLTLLDEEKGSIIGSAAAFPE